VETSFRRNSRISIAPEEMNKLTKLNSELQMEAIEEEDILEK